MVVSDNVMHVKIMDPFPNRFPLRLKEHIQFQLFGGGGGSHRRSGVVRKRPTKGLDNMANPVPLLSQR